MSGLWLQLLCAMLPSANVLMEYGSCATDCQYFTHLIRGELAPIRTQRKRFSNSTSAVRLMLYTAMLLFNIKAHVNYMRSKPGNALRFTRP